MSNGYIVISGVIILILTYNYLIKRFKYDSYKKQIDNKYRGGFFWRGPHFNVAPIPIDDDTKNEKLQKLKSDYNRSVNCFWITIIGLFILYCLISMVFKVW